MKVKLCGLSRMDDIRYVNEFQPDYVGFVFAKSRRQVTPAQAALLRSQRAPSIRAVGVFVNETPEETARIARQAALDGVQLHGDEDGDSIRRLRRLLPAGTAVWKAVRVRTAQDLQDASRFGTDLRLFDAFSKDAYGGTGKTADWGLLERLRPPRPFFLAGGLNAGNLEEAVRRVRPDGVDLSGGIETGGVKDREKIKEILTIIRGVSI